MKKKKKLNKVQKAFIKGAMVVYSEIRERVLLKMIKEIKDDRERKV